MVKPTTVDEYLATVPAERRAGFEELRRIVRAVVPEPVESISYSIVGIRSGKKPIAIWIAAYADHYSLYPYTDEMKRDLGAELEPYLSGKGTIRLPADGPLPEQLIRRVVELRLAETAPGYSGRT